jgi:hypothetical protein
LEALAQQRHQLVKVGVLKMAVALCKNYLKYNDNDKK